VTEHKCESHPNDFMYIVVLTPLLHGWEEERIASKTSESLWLKMSGSI
jgi:hypothetical protein